MKIDNEPSLRLCLKLQRIANISAKTDRKSVKKN